VKKITNVIRKTTFGNVERKCLSEKRREKKEKERNSEREKDKVNFILRHLSL